MEENKQEKNPFSPNNPDLLRYYRSIDVIQKEIQNKIIELKKRTDDLNEVQKNHIKSYEQAIDELKSTCTHVDEEGKPTTNTTFRDRLEALEHNKMRKVSQCELCGKTFISGIIEIDPEKLHTKYNSLYQGGMELPTDDDDEFTPNLFFNTNSPIQLINDDGERIPILSMVKRKAKEPVIGDDGEIVGYRYIKI